MKEDEAKNAKERNKAILYFNEVKDLCMIVAIIVLLFCAYYTKIAGVYIAMAITIVCLIITVITYIKEGSWVYLTITAILVLGLSIALPLALNNKLILGFYINIPVAIAISISVAYIVEKACFVVFETIKVTGDFFNYLLDYRRD